MNTFDNEKWKAAFASLSEAVKTQMDYSAAMKIRSMRAEIFQQTVAIVNEGKYLAKSGKSVHLPNDRLMIERTVLYSSPIHLDENNSRQEKTKVKVENCDCLLAAKALLDAGYNPAVLNMASRQNPGGGVYNGAGAQEENLFRRTNLFRSMFQFAHYAAQYGLKKSPSQYPLDMNFGGVYTPDATVFRGTEQDGYPLLDEYFQVSFIAVPAMNRPDLDKKGLIAPHLTEGVKNKMRTIFRIGLLMGHDALILGAAGCGAFRNPPVHIARLFHEVMEEEEFKDRYKLISFAILEDHNSGHEHNPEGNYMPFKMEFSNNDL
ncbi:TIGR02452 family protein [Parabacteroides sp. AM08-6]|uniref:TIGR02452 family protein n=1 Tax=Parabacteroides sp. AM08-6 TaxID=2292053 RepID=UPI000EFE4D0D|nr:TIGR02452 family protein [Parabacteroides sp. AM08-6]RHJ86504.1 TIGR02452 family protein [Parabacteroides sp. AM08-6]